MSRIIRTVNSLRLPLAVLAVIVGVGVGSLALLASYDAHAKPPIESCGIEPHIAVQP